MAGKKVSGKFRVRTKSMPRVPEMLFAQSTGKKGGNMSLDTLVDKEGKSPILSCGCCKLSVHASKWDIF